MNMYPSQVSPPRTPGSNEYVPLTGVLSKNTWAFTCSYQFNPLKLIRNHFQSKVDGGAMMLMASFEDGGDGCDVEWRWAAEDSSERRNDEPKSADDPKHDKDGPNNESDKSQDDSSPKQDNTADQQVNTASPRLNTGSFKLNTVNSSVNTATPKDMLEATHIELFNDKEELEVDLGNIPNSYAVPTTPHTRIHKDYPIENVIGDMQSFIQTRRMIQPTSEQGFLRRTKKNLQSTKNKKDERGIVIRNKARLVAQGHTQEEGINYDEVFALVARIKAIRLFLAYASYMGFMVYQMDVKSAFLYGQIEEEVYVCQPPGFEDPDYPDKVYKVVKALYGLHQEPRAWYETLANYLLSNGFQRGKIDQTLFIKKQKGDILLVQIYVDDIILGSTKKELWLQVKQKEDGIFISQDKYVDEILRKFNYTDVRTASTLLDLEKPLVKDRDATNVDEHLYRSMIGSLMYLTASRPYIMFAVCACARFLVSPKTSHLLAVKRIFRYLKGKLTLGLWYSRDSPFELVAYTNSDYAGATQDRKSTTGDLLTKVLRRISTDMQRSVIEIDDTNFKRGQDTKVPQSGGPPKKVGDEAVHKELGDRMERATTTASSLEVEQDSNAQTRFEAASKSPMTHLSQELTHLEVATARTSANGEVELTATIDGEEKTLTKASLRRHLKLEDSGGVTTLPNSEIFEQLALMGYVTNSDKLTFQKGHFSPQWRFLIHIILHCLSPKKTAWEQFSSNIATAIICLATNRTYNFKIAKFDKSAQSLDEMLESQITDKSKKGLGYNVVSPPHPLIYNRPTKLDLSYSGLDEFKEPEFNGYGPRNTMLKSTIDYDKESKNYKENTDDSLEKEQVTDNKSSSVESPLKFDKETIIDWKETFFHTSKNVECVKLKNNEKPVKKSVRYVEMYRSQSPRGNQRNWNGQKSNQLGSEFVMYNKACYGCRSFDHIQINYPNHQRKRRVTGNNYNRVDYDYYSKTSHPSSHRNMTPRVVLLKSGLKPLCTARPVYTAQPKPTVQSARPMTYFSKQAQSTVQRPFYKKTTLTNRANGFNAVKPSACWVWRHIRPNGASLLPNESQILLRIPREDNMYSFDMKNIVPKESLTCLVAKATSDESMLWHKRLGHINFKNINKLVKENLVRGLPLKRFKNDQTCVACLKGKKHRASLTKDETSEILKSFIKEIENLVDKKVKIIRCDNGTEFKNKLMDDFCKEKCIRREYNLVRTPQQNGVAERRYRTLIEASRTMVLIVKPHNKTPYELFRGIKPALSFMKPFGCHVTILNTLDSLGMFDGKSDEGFFVGYSLSSKAFRVYNTRTRKVEENLHIGFIENKPMIEGNGPKWLFDIDSLTQTMNYVPVTAGTSTNESADPSYFDSPSKEMGNDDPKSVVDDKRENENSSYDEKDDKEKSKDDSSIKQDNTADQPVNIASPGLNTSSIELNTIRSSINTATPEDMVGPSHLFEATHVELFNDEDEPDVDLGNIPTSYAVPTTPHIRIHKDHPIENVIGDI
ncbi:putative ribonuclease H-like domain-containing protein [Tanacetum coccineum]